MIAGDDFVVSLNSGQTRARSHIDKSTTCYHREADKQFDDAAKIKPVLTSWEPKHNPTSRPPPPRHRHLPTPRGPPGRMSPLQNCSYRCPGVITQCLAIIMKKKHTLTTCHRPGARQGDGPWMVCWHYGRQLSRQAMGTQADHLTSGALCK